MLFKVLEYLELRQQNKKYVDCLCFETAKKKASFILDWK